VHTEYLCGLFGSQNKQRLFPYTVLTGWFCNRKGVCLLLGTDWIFIHNSTFCPHSVLMRSVRIWKRTATISLYSNNWLVLYQSFNPLQPSGYYMYHHVKHSTILHSAHTVYLCVPYGSQNKQRLFPYTASNG